MAARLVNPPPILQILKIYTEGLTRLSHAPQACVLITTSWSQGYNLGAAPGSRKGKQNPHSKDWGEGEEPPLAHDWLVGQLVVPTFQKTPPIFFLTLS